jgi:hypothetical protein
MRISIILIIISLFVSLTTLTFASPTNPNISGEKTSVQESKKEIIRQRIEEKKLEIEMKKQEIKERIQIKKATQAAKLQDKRKENIRNYFEKINTRFSSTILRLEKLISRIENRLSVYEQQNPDLNLDEINLQIEDAKVFLLEAEADISTATENLEDTLDSEDPKAMFKIIKDTTMDAKQKLIEAHRILVHVIGDIKGLRVGNTPNTATEEANTIN